MAVIDNRVFDKVYDKLLLKLDEIVHKYTISRKYGAKINYNIIKKLNMITRYLYNIKNSNYRYYYIERLTEISNFLNRI